MNELRLMTCEPCQDAISAALPEQIQSWQNQLPQWQRVQYQGIEVLERVYESRDYERCLGFVQQIGALAQRENHHPEIVLSWGQVVVRWWTHKIPGLHRNDFILAARTEYLWPL